MALIGGFLSATLAVFAQESDDDSSIYELSPFAIDESTDQGYLASQSMAGGRLSSDIKKIGSSIQVVTQEFMNDIAATNINDLLQYTTSTETAGISGNFTGAAFNRTSGATDEEATRRNPSAANRIRGIAAPDRTRDFFKTEIPFDTYNTERIDINRGANSFLFGLGSPAGLINNGLAKAHFSNFGEVGFRIDGGGSDPSYRGSIDLNRILVEDVLAVRIAGLYDHTKFYQRPTYRNDERFYMAVTYKPFGKEGGTTIRAHYETGKIEGIPPSTLLPQENLSRFLNKPDLFPERPDVTQVKVNPVEFAREYGRNEGPYFNVETGQTLRDFEPRRTLALRFDGSGPNGINPLAVQGQIRGADVSNGNPYFDPNNVLSPNQTYVQNGNFGPIMRLGTGNAAWLNQGFVNLDTFNFAKYNLGWDDEFLSETFENYNVVLEHVFPNNNAGISISFDHQDYDRTSYTISGTPGLAEQITLDINTHMLYPTQEGSLEPAPNPNFGRPMMMTRHFNTHVFDESTRETARATLFYKLNFAKDRDDWMKWLGNHTFTLLADREEQDLFRYGSRASSYAGSFDPADHLTAADPTTFARNVPFIIYLGPPQLNAFTDPNFKLEDFVLTADNDYDFSYDAVVGEHETFYWDKRAEEWKRGTFTAKEMLQRDPNLQNILIESKALNLSSEFFDGNLVVNTGYREDTVEDLANRIPPRASDRTPVLDPSVFNLHNGTEQFAEASGSIFGWGAVAFLPESWNPMSDWMNVSIHYNESDNFVPSAGIESPLGSPLPAPTGESKDYGVSFYLFEDKVVARLNWYDSTLANRSQGGPLNQTYSDAARFLGFLNRDIQDYNEPDSDKSQYPRIEEAKQAFSEMDTLLRAQGNLYQNKEISFNEDGTVSQVTENISDTSDVAAKGFEAEIILNPTPNWRIALNLAKQEAALDRFMPFLTDFFENFYNPYVAKWGQLEFNGPAQINNPDATFSRQVDVNRFVYLTGKLQEGRPTAELRPWRFNAITNYNFSEGRLKGFGIGGALRWQDSGVIGFPTLPGVIAGRDTFIPDITNGYQGSTETNIDAFLSYRRKIFDNKIDWSIRLNVKNLNADKNGVIPIRAQPDGSIARVRTSPPRVFLLSNSFKF